MELISPAEFVQVLDNFDLLTLDKSLRLSDLGLENMFLGEQVSTKELPFMLRMKSFFKRRKNQGLIITSLRQKANDGEVVGYEFKIRHGDNETREYFVHGKKVVKVIGECFQGTDRLKEEHAFNTEGDYVAERFYTAAPGYQGELIFVKIFNKSPNPRVTKYPSSIFIYMKKETPNGFQIVPYQKIDYEYECAPNGQGREEGDSFRLVALYRTFYADGSLEKIQREKIQ